MKRILLVSPIPTHPPVAGNRARIHSLLTNLRDMGHEVHFLCVNTEPDLADQHAMARCWGKNFYFVPYTYPRRSLRRYAGRLKFLFERGFRHIQPVDYRYDSSLDDYLRKLSGEVKFDAVIVEYIFWSRAFESFQRGELKILDTLDVFTRRHLWYLDNGQTYGWYCTTAQEEAKALNRSDVVIAIQDEEKEFFSTLTRKRIITVGHLASLREPVPGKVATNTILYVGSDASANRHGILRFIRDVLPRIQSKFPYLRLHLAGRICDAVGEFEACVKLGRVADMTPVYDAADLVVNPVHYSTGMSVKTMEALGYSKPVVTSPAGSRGLEDGAGKAFLVAEHPEAFAQSVISVLSDQQLALRLSKAAHEFAETHNRRSMKEISGILK